MNNLISILKEVLSELADTNKSFKFVLKHNLTKMDSDNVYLSGKMIYEFVTDNNFKYVVQILYLPSSDDMYEYAASGDGQMVEIEFDVNNPDPQAPDYAVTNNAKELFTVMATISNIIKDSFKKDSFKYIIYRPSSTKNIGRSPKGSEQRDKLYQYYIKKEFPETNVQKIDHYIIVTLN